MKKINEDVTKQDVKDIVKQEISSFINQKKFESRVSEIVADCIEELYKTLWTRKGFWNNSIKK